MPLGARATTLAIRKKKWPRAAALPLKFRKAHPRGGNSLAAPARAALPENTTAMPLWPKSFYSFRASLGTARTEWKLRKKHCAPEEQERVFKTLVGRLAGASFWRGAGIEDGMDYARFQSRVALRTYEQLAPAIARAKRGEADVLWPGRCVFFALSAGTTTGQAKHLPVTEELLAHFRRAHLDSLLYYTVRVRHAAVFRGRHLTLGGSTTLKRVEEAQPHEAYAGDMGGITAVNLPPWIERHLHEPPPAIAQLSDWSAKIDAIVARTRGIDISLLAGAPQWALTLAAALREKSIRGKSRAANLQGVWPNFECYVHGGAPIGPYHAELRSALGPGVTFHEIYSAAEGWFAAQDGEPAAGLRVMADAGLFFEFVPMTEFDEARLDQIGKRAVPLSGVKKGADYALIVTTPAGLARYVTGDVVRFVSTEPPRLTYIGRTKLQLNAFGERVSEKDLTDALLAVCQRQNWTIANFHVAPLLAGANLTGAQRGRHEWWIELKPGTVTTPTGAQMAPELDAQLQRISDDYAAKRKAGALEPPTVRLVMPGVFEHWLRYQEKWDGQHKMPRCRSDRTIADELAQVTHFAAD